MLQNIRDKKYTRPIQRRHSNGQQVHEKLLDTTNHQRNADKNHIEMSPHSCQNGYYQKDKR